MVDLPSKETLTEAIRVAKESTEEVWGDLRRMPKTSGNSLDGERPFYWESSDTEEEISPEDVDQMVIDTVAFRTYETVLSFMLERIFTDE